MEGALDVKTKGIRICFNSGFTLVMIIKYHLETAYKNSVTQEEMMES